MKDYITEANNIGLDLTITSDRSEWVKNYKLNRRWRELRISYWNVEPYNTKLDKVKECPPEKEKEMIADLNAAQRDQFNEMLSKVEDEVRKKFKSNLPLISVYLGNGALQICLSNFLAAIPWTVSAMVYAVPLSITPKELKLVHEMKLVNWIIKNRKVVDALIHREVDEVRDVDLSHTAPVVRYDVYPTEKTPYPEEVYNEKKFRSNEKKASTWGDFSSYFE